MIWYYRKSTNQWVWEFNKKISDDLYQLYRFVGKTKFACIIDFISNCWKLV